MENESNEKKPHQQRGDKRGPSLLLIGFMLIAMIEGAAIAYLYTRFHSQTVLNLSLNDKLNRSAEAVREQNVELERRTELLQQLKGEISLIEQDKRALTLSISEKGKMVEELQRQIKEKEEKTRITGVHLERQKQIAAYLRKRLKESKSTELQLMERLEALLKKKTEMEMRVARLTETGGAPPLGPDGIPLREMVITGRAPGGGEIEGQILIANNKYGFIIVNLGSEDGITVGDEGTIARNGKKIGMAKVKKLYNKMCLADIVTDSTTGTVEKGLIVSFPRPAEGEKS